VSNERLGSKNATKSDFYEINSKYFFRSVELGFTKKLLI
jgi:hypothetical protein